jgi:hypothetical protein
MPTDTVSEVVTRPALSTFATGSYTGAESIFQQGQTLTLNLAKQADLAVAACNSAPAFTVNYSEALSVVITKTASAVTAQFSLNVNATVAIT